MKPLHILLVEDDEDDAVLFSDLLAKIGNRYQLSWVQDGIQALEAVPRDNFDVYFLDYRLSGSNTGLWLMQRLREMGVEAPIIFVSGQGDYSVDMEAMKAGASDYLVKNELTSWMIDRSIRYSLAKKKTENELRRHREDLELQVQQRTADLMAAKNRAEEANRIKSQFLANMSHELRTPLNGVIGMTELALMCNPDPEIKSYLDMLKLSGQDLLRIISDILDIAKIEAGKMKTTEESFDLRGLLDTTLAPLLLSAKCKGLEFKVTVSERTPRMVTGDPGRLGQILINLVDNAIKFTERGTVELLVDMDELHPDRLLFTVKDTGVGIASDQIDHIFENFVQGHTGRDKPGGTGLGLSIVKGLLEVMSGYIFVESEPDKGSTFSVSIPLPPVQGQAVASEGDSRNEPAPKEKLRILVVEDEKVNQICAIQMLNKLGHETQLADNGKRALEKLKNAHFDLVFMDSRMPVLSGEEATVIIRSGEVEGIDPQVPIVALTAHAQNGDRERFLAAGMDDYLSKPIDFPELERIIQRFALRRRTQAPKTNNRQA